jgi:quinol monooxygenase YgiN
MLLVAVEFRVSPGHRSEFETLAGALQEASRREDGCRFFEFWSDLDGSGRYLAYEGWESPGHLVAHRSTAHVAEFKDGIAALGAEMRAERYVASPTEV